MRRFTFILFVYMCWTIAAISQDLSTQEAIKNINKIKMDTDYLYAESTTKNWEEASDNAKAILSVMISEWAMKNAACSKDVELCVANSKAHILAIKTRRGELYRSFVYVKKSDIMPVSNGQNLIVVKVEKEPEKTVISAPVIEDIETTNEDNNSSDGLATVVDLNTPDSELAPIATLSKEEQKMKQIRSLDQAEPFVKRLQNENKLKNYGKYKTMPENEKCYLLVYNRQGAIVALLRKEGKNFFNLDAHQSDDISNYEGCGAIWIQLK